MSDGHGAYRWKSDGDPKVGKYEFAGAILAQGRVPHVTQDFYSHHVLRISLKDGNQLHYYDPSYGKHSASLIDLENQILGGIAELFSIPPAGWFSRPNLPGTAELKVE